MRAAVARQFGAPLTIEDVTIIDPGPYDVSVRVSACAICHSDLTMLSGGWGGELPAVFGHEVAGVVTRLGTGVAGISIGDHVVATLVRSCGTCFFCRSGQHVLCESSFALDRSTVLRSSAGEPIHQALRIGGFAEQIVVHESQLAPVPADMALDAACLLACGVVTGFGAVTTTAAVAPHSSVVVVGSGGVGLNCIQGAVHSKADQIVAIDIRHEKLEMAVAVGATATVNNEREDTVAAVRRLTGGRGADYVFVATGHSAAVEASIPLLRRGGILVLVGMPPSSDLATIDITDLAHNAQQIIGSKMGSVRVKEHVPFLADMYQRGDLELDGLISGRYPLDEINDAIDSSRAGSAVRNVVVFE